VLPSSAMATSGLLVALSVARLALTAGEAFVPAPADQVPLYWADPMPCKLTDDGPRISVRCKDTNGKDFLQGKTLRELAIMRNTIFARYGWDGYRKEWLRNYFHSQPWFKANPKFGYKLLSATDKKNVHFIATKENAFSQTDLIEMQSTVYAHHGKVWNDKPVWRLMNGKTVTRCDEPESTAEVVEGVLDGNDCRFERKPWFKPNPHYTDDQLTDDDRIELGLLSRAMGLFAVDGEKLDTASQSLDRILTVTELRKMSLRDLRYLRNTIYARHGRPFKSKVLQEHFAQMDWYQVDAQYTDAKLTTTDNRNIKLIRSVEDEFGGPLGDEDWLIDPATDGA
jgi:hypothetical protein